jgi:hypothetical protein
VSKLLQGSGGTLHRLPTNRDACLFAHQHQDTLALGVLWVEHDTGFAHIVQVILQSASENEAAELERPAELWKAALEDLPPETSSEKRKTPP